MTKAEQVTAKQAAAAKKAREEKQKAEALAAKAPSKEGVTSPVRPAGNHEMNVARADAAAGKPSKDITGKTEAQLQAEHDAAFDALVSTPERDETDIRLATETARKGRRTKSLTEEEVVQVCDAYLKMAEGRRPRVTAEGADSELERLRGQVAWYAAKGSGNV